MRKRISFMYKIVAIMVLVLLLVGVTGTYTYNRFTEIVSRISQETRPDLRLITAKSLINDITDAENSVKSFSLTKDTLYLAQFYEAAQRAENKLAELELINSRARQKIVGLEKMDSLISEKFMILNDLLVMQDEYRVQAALDKLASNIERAAIQPVKPHSPSLAKAEVDPDNGSTDSTDQKFEKKGILSWLFGRNTKKRSATEIAKQERAVSNNEPKPELDHRAGPEEKITLYAVNREVQDVKNEEIGIETAIRARELNLIMADKAVSDKIRNLLGFMEIAEAKYIQGKTHEAEVAVERTNRQIAVFCIVIGLLLAIMAFIIANYVSNNRRYRRALRKARNEAEELAAAKERFLANMSHEIRTPMNAISGFVEQIASGPLTDEQRDQLTMVRKSTEHLQYLVNDVLDFTKLQTGKLKLEKVGFKLPEVILDVITFVKPLAREKKLEITSRIRSGTPEILQGDPFRLRQILLNLLSNAIKFTERGSISVSTSAHLSAPNITNLTLKVTDTGIGMEEKQLDKLFQEFEQGEVSTARIYGGTGLGLSITKMLVELQGGSIELRSNRDEGTVVIIDLKYEIGNASQLVTDLRKTPESTTLKGSRGLIVDDEPYNRKLIATILKKHGIEFDEAENGRVALDKLKSQSFDMVLMDIRMPEMNGIETTSAIRASKNRKIQGIPIIALTAAVSDMDRKKYREIGMDGFLPKPFKEFELINELLSVMGKSRTADKSPETQTNNIPKRFNFRELFDISNGDMKFYKEMLQTFKQSTQKGLMEIHDAVAKKNWPQIAENAHKMCSPARHIEAKGLYQYLKDIETKCRNQVELDTIAESLNAAEYEADLVFEEIEGELNNL